MIVTKDFPNRSFTSKEELHKEYFKNADLLKLNKASEKKNASSYVGNIEVKKIVDLGTTKSVSKCLTTNKEITIFTDNENNVIEVKFVVNMCGIMDSHDDVHINGCWTKTAKENKRFKHLQDHKMLLDYFVSKDVSLSIEKFNINGVECDALVCTSRIKRKTNPKIYDMYIDKDIDEHSVGMLYIWDKIELCIDTNDSDYKEYKENFDKYYKFVANKEAVDARGVFWAILEAKGIEGSSVVLGSNSETPTLEVTEIKEPSNDTQKENKQEPTEVTQQQAIETIKNYFKLN